MPIDEHLVAKPVASPVRVIPGPSNMSYDAVLVITATAGGTAVGVAG